MASRTRAGFTLGTVDSAPITVGTAANPVVIRNDRRHNCMIDRYHKSPALESQFARLPRLGSHPVFERRWTVPHPVRIHSFCASPRCHQERTRPSELGQVDLW